MKKLLISFFALVAAFAHANSPYATEIVASTNLSGDGMYNDPAAALGKPATQFLDFYGTGESSRVKLIEPAYWTTPEGRKTVVTIDEGDSLTVKFDHPVEDDPNNPYGLDFNVFGNDFFLGDGGFVGDSTNLNEFTVGGDAFPEPLKISVSPDNEHWYTYENGPYADSMMPTNAYKWDRAAATWTDQEMDFTRPINPALFGMDLTGRTAADILDLYDGAAGGVGFDLKESGFRAIQYIRVTGTSDFQGGEIDGFADVSPQAVPEPASLTALGLGAAALLRRRKGGRA